MIGSVQFVDPDGDALLTATLEDDGTWTCPRSAWIARWLNVAFNPTGVLGDSPCWGHWSVLAAARCLKGLPSFMPPGTGLAVLPGELQSDPINRPLLPCRYHGAIGPLTDPQAAVGELLSQG